MKAKVFTLIIGILIGAIIASSGFLIWGNVNKKNQKDFDPSKFKDGNFTPPSGFNGDPNSIDMENFDPSKRPERPSK